jgi:glycosyltransferase involved in cell wall biosynthesis
MPHMPFEYHRVPSARSGGRVPADPAVATTTGVTPAPRSVVDEVYVSGHMPERDGEAQRPRVMQLVVGGDVGGAERLLVDLASRPEESRADHETALFTSNPALHELFVGSGLVVHRRGKAPDNPLAYLSRSLGPFDVEWLTRLLHDRRIDILHTHTLGSHVLGTRAARAAGCPQLRTEHHIMHYTGWSSSPFTRWAAQRTDRFVAVSEYVRGVLVRTAPRVAERTTVVRNGVDERIFAARPRAVAPFSAAIVGRLASWKRVELAIVACALADVSLVVVGEGDERRRLEELARSKRASIRFTGHQKDPRPFFAACDVTLNTSKAEPLGLSVLESLAMERPVIGFATGGIPEIVEDGRTGWLVEDTGPGPLVAALRRAKVERDRLPSMGVAGRRFVEHHASIGAMCRGYAREYEGLWRPSSARPVRPGLAGKGARPSA